MKQSSFTFEFSIFWHLLHVYSFSGSPSMALIT